MHRRRLLHTAGAGLLLGTAGCLGRDTATDTSTSTDTATATPDADADVDAGGTSADTGALRDVELPLDDVDLRRGAAKDAIPAITDPVFGENWSDVEASLEGADRVVGVEVDGEARAYPLAILNWHEVVNDSFGGPLLVTFCPLCGSGVTAERRVDGETTLFGVSGKLWMSDLVMYDERTESLWSQVLGKAVQGPETGTALTLRPSTITTWREWREGHPDTSVLLPPPASNTITGGESRNYDVDPYNGYEDSRRIGIGASNPDDRLHPKTSVIGVAADGVARAYPNAAVENAGGVVNDTVADLPVVVAVADGSLAAYVRRVDGETLQFGRDGDVLVADGSRWAVVSGAALDGPHEGTTLERANSRSEMFWFAWVDFFPDSEIYGQ
ncbi:MAG: protein of unknown function (DUF3179) [uncultured archaeon A07HR67]|nr:MAG: protein of unknown function (DUF3179) [uncultured archaeon A07HR67]